MIERRRIAIVGAGLSGLSLAYHLLAHPRLEVTLLERAKRPGGWVRTLRSDAGLFEAGPRGVRLRGNSGKSFYQLCQQLQLPLIASSQQAARRYIYSRGQLQAVSLWGASQATQELWRAILKEPWQAAPAHEDMTLEAFLSERFGAALYRSLLEPALLGVFGCPGSLLSAKACLPSLWHWRERYGSLLLAWAARQLTISRHDRASKLYRKAPLVSFQGGMGQLVDRLHQRVSSCLCLGQQLLQVHSHRSRRYLTLVTSDLELEVDQLVITCSPWSLGAALDTLLPSWSSFRQSLSSSSLALVHLGFDQPLPKEYGFGYLVPSSEQEPLLGAVIDSNLFPQHSRGCPGRVSVMMPWDPNEGLNRAGASKGSAQSKVALAKLALSKQLRWAHSPQWEQLLLLPNALPIYGLGHTQRWQALQEQLRQLQLPLAFTGLGYEGFALAGCIEQAQQLASKLIRELA